MVRLSFKIKASISVSIILSVLAWFSNGNGSQTYRSGGTPKALPVTEEVTVTKVQDGDTIRVWSNGNELTVELCGIDAPELAQPLGEQSKGNLENLIDRAGGVLIISKIAKNEDGSWLAEVSTNQTNVLSYEQARTGMAYFNVETMDNCPNRERIAKGQAQAKKEKTGVWHNPNAIPPSDYRQKLKKPKSPR